MSSPFKNIITDKQAKENIGDNVLAYLVNIKEITTDDFKNLIIEFGYLFLDNNNSGFAAWNANRNTNAKSKSKLGSFLWWFILFIGS